MGLRIAALVKQIPRFEVMELGPDGRLRREGVELEMSAYCRRAVSKGVELARATGGSCTVMTLGPPSAEDVLREAVAWGADDGVLLSDPAFAGSDTWATARALAALLEREGPFDLVLTGRNSLDADTGQVGPQLAVFLDLPFVTGARHIELGEGRLDMRCEHDDEEVEVRVALPAVVSVAERLCEPAKVPPDGRAAVDPAHLRARTAVHVGAGPWGAQGSLTTVGEVRALDVPRARVRLEGGVEQQVAEAVAILRERRALDPGPMDAGVPVPATGGRGPVVAAVLEPGRQRLARELLGGAAGLAAELGGSTVALAAEAVVPEEVGSWGADAVVVVAGADVEEDVASGVAAWAAEARPWAVLAPGTAWGREVASRAAAVLGAGLTGDAVGLGVEDGRLVAWKPAFGGRLTAAIRTTSSLQMATVRSGVLPVGDPRPGWVPSVRSVAVLPRRRVVVHRRTRLDDGEALANAAVVVGVGRGVPPSAYPEVRALAARLGGELAASRKVTDEGWLPRSRQVGITGHSIAPRLYVAVGTSGKFNHMIGVRGAGTVVAVNPDPEAPVFEVADVGLVGSWEELLPALVDRIEAQAGAASVAR